MRKTGLRAVASACSWYSNNTNVDKACEVQHIPYATALSSDDLMINILKVSCLVIGCTADMLLIHCLWRRIYTQHAGYALISLFVNFKQYASANRRKLFCNARA